jgi:endoglucanase
LNWLLKMQNADGSVMHKADSGSNFAWGKLPEDDPNERRATFASTIDAADFTAVMMQASRVFGPIEPAFSRQCRTAADKSRAWLEKNPAVLHDDPFYVDKDPSGERLWALAEVLRQTGDRQALNEFRKTAGERRLPPPAWMSPEFLGYMSLAMAEDMDPAVRELAKRSMQTLADSILQKASLSGYGVSAGPDEYYWGSVENTLHRAAVLICVHQLTGDEKYREGALRQLDYCLGRNALGMSFVAGYGTVSPQRPYHWTRAALGKVMPGWASGGPNSGPEGADPLLKEVQKLGTPPAKCFVDGDSWASNEGQTTENAALLFVAGYLTEERR